MSWRSMLARRGPRMRWQQLSVLLRRTLIVRGLGGAMLMGALAIIVGVGILLEDDERITFEAVATGELSEYADGTGRCVLTAMVDRAPVAPTVRVTTDPSSNHLCDLEAGETFTAHAREDSPQNVYPGPAGRDSSVGLGFIAVGLILGAPYLYVMRRGFPRRLRSWIESSG